MYKERPISPSDLSQCMALSREAGWNQAEADWRMILQIGVGQGLFEGGRLVGSAMVIPYGGVVGWVCMVLVAADHRRRGHATRLMRWALATSRERGLVPGLDATPDGRPVYEKMGFADIFALTRLRASAVVPTDGQERRVQKIRPLTSADIDAAISLDTKAFGADRSRLMKALYARKPELAFICQNHDRIDGFVLAREGRTATQIGPIIARDETTALTLVSAVLPRVAGTMFIDLADHHTAARHWLEERGFAPQRPLMRMLAGRRASLGEPGMIVAAAGPELG